MFCYADCMVVRGGQGDESFPLPKCLNGFCEDVFFANILPQDRQLKMPGTGSREDRSRNWCRMGGNVDILWRTTGKRLNKPEWVWQNHWNTLTQRQTCSWKYCQKSSVWNLLRTAWGKLWRHTVQGWWCPISPGDLKDSVLWTTSTAILTFSVRSEQQKKTDRISWQLTCSSCVIACFRNCPL